jgi:hypothetical protein
MATAGGVRSMLGILAVDAEVADLAPRIHDLRLSACRGQNPESNSPDPDPMSATQIAIVEDVFLSAAKQHGEDSEPGHEAGDIQQFFRSAYALLTPSQRDKFAAQQDVIVTLRAARIEIKSSDDGEDYIDAAESFGTESESELTALIAFFKAAFRQLDEEQRKALVDDDWVQETLQNAVGIDADLNDGVAIYSAVAEGLQPKSLAPH